VVDFDVGGPEFGDGFRFSEPNGADFRVGEDDGGDVFVGEVGG